MTLQDELSDLEARAAAVRRRIAAAPCAEVGHRWRFIGGACICCSDGCGCSTSVHKCEVCGDCDYGDNEERDEVIARCKEFGRGN